MTVNAAKFEDVVVFFHLSNGDPSVINPMLFENRGTTNFVLLRQVPTLSTKV